jgi:hypothetical protein
MKIRHTKILAPLAIASMGLAPLLHGCGGDAANKAGTGGGAGGSTSTANSTSSDAASIPTPPMAEAGKVPPPAEIESLAKDTLGYWNEGVQSKDFSVFHDTISKAWADQATAEDLAKSFKPITDQNAKGTNLAPALENMKPVMSPATIDKNGLLVVKGYYPTKPSRANFELKYILEEGEWKTAGVNVKMDKAP